MNTMVGLEASLHTSVSDGISSDLMKNNYNNILPTSDSEPIQLNGAGMLLGGNGADDDNMMQDDDDDDDDDGVADIFDDDDFDPDILLRSPLFNDSTGRLEFDTDQASSVVVGTSTTSSNSHGDAGVDGAGGYTSPGEQPKQQQQRAPHGGAVQQEQDLYDVNNVSSSGTGGTLGGYHQDRSSFLSSPPKRTFSSPASFVSPYQVVKQHGMMSNGGSTDLARMSHSVMSTQMAFANNNNNNNGGGVLMDNSSGGQRSDGSTPTRRVRGFPGSPTSRALPARAVSYQSPRKMSAVSLQQMQQHVQQQQQQQQLHPGLQPMQLTTTTSTGMAQQQQHSSMQTMQMPQQSTPMRPLPQMRPLGLSQTMHGQYSSAAATRGHDPLIGSLGPTSLHVGTESAGVQQQQQQQQHHHVHFVGHQSGNVSIAAGPDQDNDKNQYNPFAGMGGMSNGNPHQSPIPLNEAMEKLCESMKRSAMSRNLVKQYSGRNVVRQNSFRGGVARTGSFRGVVRQNSGRMLGGTARTLLDDSSSGRGQPIRMPPTKHHLEHHGRGVYRHNSAQNLNAGSSHGINLQIDGRNMGAL